MRLRHFLPAALLAFATLSARADMKVIPNPCGIFTEQDVSAIVGTPAKFGMKMDAAGLCMYNGANAQPIFSIRGLIFDNVHDSAENYDALSRVATKSVESLTGIGDKAEIITTMSGDIMLCIVKGTKLFSITLLHGGIANPAARKPALTQAGRQAVPRL